MKRMVPGIAGVLVIALVLVSPVGADTWETETVDSNGYVGEYTSLALDSLGYPHISYYDGTNTNLKYALRNGAGWNLETVDNDGDVGRDSSLALDASGTPYISYYDYTRSALKYATLNGAEWDTTTIAYSAGMDNSLALDSLGSPHISYYSGSPDYDLKYYTSLSLPVLPPTVDSDGAVGRFSSLAFDTSDNPHISYYDNSNGALKYALGYGVSWDITTVDSDGYAGTDSSLALDSVGTPHISYDGGSPDYELKYASRNGTGWDIEIVDSDGHVGEYTSLALNASGYPRISYYNTTGYDLKYASWDGASWDITTVESDGNVGQYTSLALDTDGNPHISYYDASNHELKYARMWTAPVAGFTASPESGPAPLTVVFNDTSTGQPTAWSWSFGDGGVSTEQNPTHTYQTPGTYDVTMTVSNQDGSDSLTETGSVTVAIPPFMVYDIPLSAGWNMVSAPVTGPVLSKPTQMTDTVYEYNPVGRTYAEANLSALEPGVGYWVSATADCTLSVNGSYMDCYTTNLSSGWNMIGSVSANASFADPETIPAGSVQDTLYGYSPSLQTYVTTATLVPGEGYWASATQDCVLNVTV